METQLVSLPSSQSVWKQTWFPAEVTPDREAGEQSGVCHHSQRAGGAALLLLAPALAWAAAGQWRTRDQVVLWAETLGELWGLQAEPPLLFRSRAPEPRSVHCLTCRTTDCSLLCCCTIPRRVQRVNTVGLRSNRTGMSTPTWVPGRPVGRAPPAGPGAWGWWRPSLCAVSPTARCTRWWLFWCREPETFEPGGEISRFRQKKRRKHDSTLSVSSTCSRAVNLPSD